MRIPQQLTAAYKAVRQIAEADRLDPMNVRNDCAAIANGILRLLHEIDPHEYSECVTWDVGRVEFPTE